MMIILFRECTIQSIMDKVWVWIGAKNRANGWKIIQDWKFHSWSCNEWAWGGRWASRRTENQSLSCLRDAMRWVFSVPQPTETPTQDSRWWKTSFIFGQTKKHKKKRVERDEIEKQPSKRQQQQQPAPFQFFFLRSSSIVFSNRFWFWILCWPIVDAHSGLMCYVGESKH